MQLRPSILVGLLAATLAADAVAAPTAPLDAMGRPLLSEGARVHHRADGTAWVKSTAGDGLREVPASAAFADTPPPWGGGPGTYDVGYTLLSYVAHPTGSWPEAVAIGDVTGDGLADVVMTTTFYFDANDYHVFVFPQQPNGALGAPTKVPYEATASRNGLALVDLDGNSVLDVVVGHASGISILLADGAGGLKPAAVVAALDCDTLSAMDVDLDGHADLIGLSWGSGATIFYGDGAGGIAQQASLATNASGFNDHEVADLDGDGFPDLAVMSGQGSGPDLTVHSHDGLGALSTSPKTYSPGWAAGVGLGDVNGDGKNDAVLSHPNNSPTYIWQMLQDATGMLTGPTTIPSLDIPESVEVADLDGDGDEDVAVVHGGWVALGVYLQEQGALAAETLYPLPYASHYAPQGLAAGDFTGDGCPDVAIGDYNSGLVTLTGVCLQGGGGASAAQSGAGGAPGQGGAGGAGEGGTGAVGTGTVAATSQGSGGGASSGSGGAGPLGAARGGPRAFGGCGCRTEPVAPPGGASLLALTALGIAAVAARARRS